MSVPSQPAGFADDPGACFAVRARVRTAIEAGIEELLVERERDPDRALLSRLLRRRAPRAAGVPVGSW